jgi:uncharacterized repeat protein (TIGR02543 family)
MASSARSKARKSSGHGGSASSGRLRLTILLATVAAFLLVPASQAFAEFGEGFGTGHIKVNISGSGSGEVTSKYGNPSQGHILKGVPPVECSYNGASTSGTCEGELESNEAGGEFGVIFMMAVPAPGSELVGWTVQEGEIFSSCEAEAPSIEEQEVIEQWENNNQIGGLHPEGICGVGTEEAGNTEVTAVFTSTGPAGPALTIAKTGEGTVASSPAGIECTGAKTGAECEHAFELNEMVTLTASPASGYAFSAWAGCTEHVGLTCKVKMEKAKTVKVTFVATPSLTVEKAGSGQGKVGAPGISCDENCSKATSAVKTGTSVTVKVTPAKGSEAAVFENGTGSASGCSGASCTFTISANSSVKVKFSPIPTHTLTVNLTGPAAYKGKVTGKGTLKGLTGSAINCGSGCTTQTESFLTGDTVTLTAVAGTGYTFAGWSGSEAGTCTGTTSPCTISTSANKTLSAEFK